MTLLLAVITTMTSWALDPIFNTTYTATSGTAGASGQNYGNLVDGNRSTKWCVVNHNYSNNNSIYIEFESAVAFVPTGYVLTTGTDNQDFTGRNPKVWLIRAKRNVNDEWDYLSEF